MPKREKNIERNVGTRYAELGIAEENILFKSNIFVKKIEMKETKRSTQNCITQCVISIFNFFIQLILPSIFIIVWSISSFNDRNYYLTISTHPAILLTGIN